MPVILVAEDDEMLREAVCVALELEGFSVLPATDGLHALSQAEVQRPSVVVLDIGLPKLDGFGVADALRERHGASLSILAVTADGRAREKAERVGAYSYLQKPFDLDVLIERVREGLEGD